MVSDPFLMGVFFGFVPAMGFLYLVLHEYQALFSEKRIFRTFFVGLLVGVLVTVAEQFLSPAVRQLLGASVLETRSLVVLAVFSLLLATLESLVFAAVLNWKTFRGRRDTPFYGVAFGLGFGATNVLFLMGMILAQRGEQSRSTEMAEIVLLSLLGTFFIGGILVHAAMGGWIGRGAAVGPLPLEVARAVVARTLYVGLYYGVLLTTQPLVSHALALGGVAFGIFLVARTITHVLDRVVPPEVLREMGIHHRRLARRVLRDERPEEPPR